MADGARCACSYSRSPQECGDNCHYRQHFPHGSEEFQRIVAAYWLNNVPADRTHDGALFDDNPVSGARGVLAAEQQEVALQALALQVQQQNDVHQQHIENLQQRKLLQEQYIQILQQHINSGLPPPPPPSPTFLSLGKSIREGNPSGAAMEKEGKGREEMAE